MRQPIDLRRARTGDSWRSEPFALTETKAWADLTGDTHPLHLDADYAAQTPFGEPIVQGLFVLAAALGRVPVLPASLQALLRVEGVRFIAPVRIGEEIMTDLRVASVRPTTKGTLIWLELAVSTTDGRRVVRGRVEVLTPRDDATDV